MYFGGGSATSFGIFLVGAASWLFTFFSGFDDAVFSAAVDTDVLTDLMGLLPTVSVVHSVLF